MSISPLLAHDLVRTLGGRRILDGVSLTAAPGQRIGIIGENGVGKSTLLRLLAGFDEPDAGQIVRPDDLGYLHQEMPFDPGATIADVVADALREVRHELAEVDRLTSALSAIDSESPLYEGLLTEYGEQLERAQQHDAWDADRRAELMLAGLGLGSIPWRRRLDAVSGGERGRLALAAVLIRRPAALVLDEPTNHLDDTAAAFLEVQLREQPGAVVLASHDRAFLDAACTDLIDLDPSADGPTRYRGDYTSYLDAQRDERQRWERRFAEEQAELRELRHAVTVTARNVAAGRARSDHDKMGYGRRSQRIEHQVSSRVRNATRRLDELERSQVRRPPPPLRLRAATLTVPSADGLLVSIRDVRVPGRLSLDRLDVPAEERLLITGANGSGKSTLLAVLAGRLVPGAGEVSRRRGLRIGLLAQDTAFDRPDRTAQEIYTAVLGDERVETVPLRSLGLLAARDLSTPVGNLSVGQRRRLALALLFADPPDLLLLDEPTNHLSPRLADELEDALGASPGAVVIATHDRWLRSRWASREFALRAAV